MKLEDLLHINEATVSTAVAPVNKPLKGGPIKRTGFMNYSADNSCRGCNIIKKYGWHNQSSKKNELKCTFCGTVHKKEVKKEEDK